MSDEGHGHAAVRPRSRSGLLRRKGANLVVVATTVVGLIGLLSVILRDERGQPRTVTGGSSVKARKVGDVFAEMRDTRLGPRRDGWSIRLRDLVLQERASSAVESDQKDRTRGEAVAAAIGLDARVVRRLAGFGSFFLTADRLGNRLLLGGMPSPPDGPRRFGSRLLLDVSFPTSELPSGDMGPVAFRPDNTPVQLVARPGSKGQPDALLLVELGLGKIVTRFDIPGSLAMTYYHELGLAPDASMVGASVRGPDGEVRLVVWNAAAPSPRHQFPTASQCIAFTADGSLVAAGDERGFVSVWSTSSGRPVGTYFSSTMPVPIRCLAFGPPQAEYPLAAGQSRTWPLAASNIDGTIEIRPVRERPYGMNATPWPAHGKQDPEVTCKAQAHDVSAMAFSADGTLLATCGEDRAHLWDPTNGRLLLTLDAGPDLRGLAFSPQGRNLAFCSAREDEPGTTSIWSIRDGGAIKLLRGLAERFAVCAPCPDPNVPLIAAWSRQGRINVWSWRTGILQHNVPTPTLPESDQPALALSPDGKRLAFAGGEKAYLWDIQEQGRARERSITLQPRSPRATSRRDALSFVAADRLILTRVESDRVLRWYDLMASEPGKPLMEAGGLGGRVEALAATSSGDTALLLVAPADPSSGHRVRAYGSATGKPSWSATLSNPPRAERPFLMSPDGKLLTVLAGDEGPVTVFDVATGKELPLPLRGPVALGSDGATWISWTNRTAEDPGGIRVYSRAQEQPLFSIPFGMIPGIPAEARFAPGGEYAAWLNTDNTVTVCDLVELNRRLRDVGLGW